MSQGDVDWAHGSIHIRASKFHESRLVPLHPSVFPVLREYARLRDLLQRIARMESFLLADRGSVIPNEMASGRKRTSGVAARTVRG